MSEMPTNSFLSALPHEDYRDLVHPHLNRLKLRAGQFLHHAGQSPERVVFPHSGVVALTLTEPWHLATDSDSGGVVAALLGRKAIIGAVAAAAAVPATCNAMVLVSGNASDMSAATFRHLMNRNDSIRSLAAQFISDLTAHLEGMAYCHAKHTVEARLCRLLCEISSQSGQKKILLVQDSLARMLGVRRTTINQVLRTLIADGLLKSRRGSLEIVDQDELGRRRCLCGLETNGYSIAPALDQLGDACSTTLNA